MKICFASAVTDGYLPDANEEVFTSIFNQYEAVLINSIITSFGLDFLVPDRVGGSVDTIHNVRQGIYQDSRNASAYSQRGEYQSAAYHSHPGYIEKNRAVSAQKKSGGIRDEYTGEWIGPKEKSDLDHTISAKKIHDDPGRVLAGLKGEDLANSPENLHVTNPHTNRTKKADNVDDFLKRHGDEYSSQQKARMRDIERQAKKSYERKLAYAYYCSPKFAVDVANAAMNRSAKMSIRQALGFVFTEIWFAVKIEFQKIKEKMNLNAFLSSVKNGIQHGIENAKQKYKQLIHKIEEGIAAGFLSSITETLCNIFFTTTKTTGKIIKESWASLVQAAKILFINPDRLPLGERLRAVAKILSVGASSVIGGIVTIAVNNTGIGKIPVIGDIVAIFCGTFVTGIMSCTLLYFLDRSEIVAKLCSSLNGIHFMDAEVAYYREQAEYFERYAAKLMEIDLERFKKETTIYISIADAIQEVKSEEELNCILKTKMREEGIEIPWQGEFDNFMQNKESHLVFK